MNSALERGLFKGTGALSGVQEGMKELETGMQWLRKEGGPVLPAEKAGLSSEFEETKEEVNIPPLGEHSGPSQRSRAWRGSGGRGRTETPIALALPGAPAG